MAAMDEEQINAIRKRRECNTMNGLVSKDGQRPDSNAMIEKLEKVSARHKN